MKFRVGDIVVSEMPGSKRPGIVVATFLTLDRRPMCVVEYNETPTRWRVFFEEQLEMKALNYE